MTDTSALRIKPILCLILAIAIGGCGGGGGSDKTENATAEQSTPDATDQNTENESNSDTETENSDNAADNSSDGTDQSTPDATDQNTTNESNSETDSSDSAPDTNTDSSEQSTPDATDQNTTDANTETDNNTAQTTPTPATAPTTPLERINAYRQHAGLNALTINDELTLAASNHASYLLVHPLAGHDEIEGQSGFTGESASDRAIHAKFSSRIVSENISQGNDDYADSIDSLMSAIYHRFGFLDSTIDLIGFAKAETTETTAFVYNMANAAQNQLCQSESTFESGRYYVDVCDDKTLKIGVEDWDATELALQQSSDDIILWPPIEGSDIEPVFYEESPDPLPDYSVSGQPISIEFNPASAAGDSTVVITSFSLKKGERTVTPIRAMDQSTDPNRKFDAHQFAWFPLERLDWNSTYTVDISYEINGTPSTLNWQFSTRQLPTAPILITSSTELAINSGDTIYLVFKPTNGQSNGAISSQYASSQTLDIEQIDLETTKLTLEGPSGSEAQVTKGEYVVTLKVN